MDINIQQLILNSASDDWWKILASGLFGAVFTVIAMGILSHIEKRRWEQDIFQKTKVELILGIINVIIKLIGNIETIINKKELEFKDEYLKNIKTLEELSYEFHIIADIDEKLNPISEEFEILYFEVARFHKVFLDFDNLAKNSESKIINLKTIDYGNIGSKRVDRQGNIKDIPAFNNQNIFSNLRDFCKLLDKTQKQLSDILNGKFNSFKYFLLKLLNN